MRENSILFEEGKRKCSHCKEIYTLEENFRKRKNKTGKDAYEYRCHPCLRKNRRETRRNNVERYRGYAKKLYIKNKKYIYDILLKNPCVVCGESDPACLDFDHIDPSEKEFHISQSVYMSAKKVQKEIEKCQVLCANCHRKKTAKQFGWYSWLNLEDTTASGSIDEGNA